MPTTFDTETTKVYSTVPVLLRDQVRQGALEAAGFQVQAWVEPQWGPIVIFAVLLVAAIAIIAWMVRALVRGMPEGS